jgi:hypothetical protein
MTQDIPQAKSNLNSIIEELREAREDLETVDESLIGKYLTDWNETVRNHEQCTPLTPDKLTVEASVAFSELDEQTQKDWLMEWWWNLEKAEPMAEHVVEIERECRETRDTIPIPAPNFGYLVEDTFYEFTNQHVNEDAFEAIGAKDVLADALQKMEREVAGKARKIWDSDD